MPRHSCTTTGTKTSSAKRAAGGPATRDVDENDTSKERKNGVRFVKGLRPPARAGLGGSPLVRERVNYQMIARGGRGMQTYT